MKIRESSLASVMPGIARIRKARSCMVWMETLERPFRESYTNELLAIQEDVTRVGRFMLEMVDTGI